jgi:hypothetical protein
MADEHNPRWEGERRWARDQLEVAEATEGETRLVMRMLEQWWEDGLSGSDDVWRALGMFETLARGKALEPPRQAGFDWTQAQPGRLVVRDYVRVRLDAYEGATGKQHNGRSGPIVAIRHGDIIVRYDDGGPVPAMGVRHSPHVLEKRIAR